LHQIKAAQQNELLKMFLVTVSTFLRSHGLNKILALAEMLSPVANFHCLLMNLEKVDGLMPVIK
jgi:hypothetical protein